MNIRPILVAAGLLAASGSLAGQPTDVTAVEVVAPVTPRSVGSPLPSAATSTLPRAQAKKLAADYAALLPNCAIAEIAAGGRMAPSLDANAVVVYEACRLDELASNDEVIFDDFRGRLVVARVLYRGQGFAVVRADNVRGPVAAVRLIPPQVRGRVVVTFHCELAAAAGTSMDPVAAHAVAASH